MFKRLVIATMSAGVAVLGAGAVVDAAPDDGPSLNFSPDVSILEPGDLFSINFYNCQPGETVEFTLDNVTQSRDCDNGVSVLQLEPPNTPGVYTVSAIGTELGIELTRQLTIVPTGTPPGPNEPSPNTPPDDLADTGTDVTQLAVLSAVALLAGGLSISLWLRRRAA